MKFLTWLLLSILSLNVGAVDLRVSAMPLLTQSSWASGDVFMIGDLSAAVSKKTTVADFDGRYVLAADFSSLFDTDLATKDTADLAEGTNLYYTTARFDTQLATKTTANLTEGANLYYTAARFNTALGTKTTADLTEGANLYYTTARWDTQLATKTTANLTEGANLYYTAARFNTAFGGKSTTDLSEGSNLYYTDGRAQTATISQVITNGVTTKASSEDALFDALALKAPLASPTFTGTPTLPTGTIAVTQSAGDNSTAVATTAFFAAGTALKENLRTEMYNKIFIEFFTLTDNNWASSTSGGTPSVSTTGINSTENSLGVAKYSVSAVNDRTGGGLGTAAAYLGSGSGLEFNLSFRMAWGALPDGTDTTKTYLGVNDLITGNGTSEPVDGVFFRYDPTVNSGKVQAVSRTTSADTEVFDTGHTPTNAVNDVYKIVILNSGVATFYINGTLKATTVSTLPCPAAIMVPFIKQIKTAGAGAKLINVDYVMLEYIRTTAR